MRVRMPQPWWWRSGVLIPKQRRPRANARIAGAPLIWRLPADLEKVALTFDDGPDPVGTPAVLNLLERHQARASFFVLTDGLPSEGRLVLEVASAGHTICLHGDRHEALDSASADHAAQRLLAARQRLEDLVQRPISLYRPPYGRTSVALFRGAARAGLTVVMWSHDPRDWAFDRRYPLPQRLVESIQPGAVVLLHDRLHGTTADPGRGALARALGRLSERGLSAVGLRTAFESPRVCV
jgi:peptidoglycan/xylan/chitin deacetylase (PgdA/CDA1 family)